MWFLGGSCQYHCHSKWVLGFRLWVLGVGLMVMFGCVGDGVMRKGAGERGVVSVMTYNTGDLRGHPRPSTEVIVAAIEAESVPDVLLLQEIYGEKQAGALARALGRDHFVFSFYTGQSNGVAILSAYPLENSDTLYFEDSPLGYGAIAADIRVGGQGVTVVSCHMDSVFWDLENHSKVLAEFEAKD
jgi:endonuclease/exonuclease/phosphatase family metal-dependent hydrolase